ncbi:dTDP-4-dehydrorhamnose reductase [Cellulophaga sp. F20128]|uniref:dTDP-4-dehydrorhamnose reductase n=1 Tax=Cellulophaga sp. F20128 TaxID=2926413 RepID=UPI001FF3B6B1|nr:dTDP-4-dehydrorhamnose reductase [Cellulophaga sp. F20128]MCK0158135.1 dTDP-4-dehydrorhamnose reductase [Cellulophaga sp. F20128]
MSNKILKILVTGANGQLGKCIQDVAKSYPQFNFHFKTSKDLNISEKEQLGALFDQEKYDFCVNCAAYTAVDKAETEKDKAYLVNAEAVRYLAEVCKEQNCVLIHISTDFVFDGNKTTPYTEEDIPNPINVYGASKLKGEQYIHEILEKYFIFRTSWVYSEYGNNFVKTMLHLGKEREVLSVVNDQIGSPTYAGDLAKLVLGIIEVNSNKYGLYHYSNEGKISWYEFATEIFKQKGLKTKVNPIATEEYPTPARRPLYSVLDNSKIKERFKLEELTLSKIISNLNI